MRALWLSVALSVAVETQTEVEHRRGGAHRHALQPERRDARDLTRAKDEARWKDDEKRMEDASAELNKLHAERDRLKAKEVTILSNREAATKSAIEDSTLVIERLEGQVKSQEKELAKQKGTISGLEKDLSMMGQALLSRKEPKEKEEKKEEKKEDGNERLVAGLEADVQREGAALLAKGDKTIREKLLGREARALADRARVLEQVLERPESAASARPLAAALSQDARKLEHALLHTEDPVASREVEDRSATDVARAVELERRPGAAHLEPAELETPERLAAERAEREAQLQRAEEREVQQEQVATLEARGGSRRAHLPRLVHHQAEVADAEEAPALDAPALDAPEADANITVAEPAVLTEQDADADVADSDVDATADEEADAAADSADDSADDSDAPDDGQPSPGDTMPSDDRAQRLSA